MSDFARDLRTRREAAGLSQQQLAEHTGLDVRTVRNLEHGSRPSAETLARLRRVEALGMPEPLPEPPDLEPNAYLVPDHDGMRLYRDLHERFNGPGGHVEQTCLYLDGKSAIDWVQLSSSGPYAAAFRDSMPMAGLAGEVHAQIGAAGLDVHGLGAGDGHSETRLVQYLCDARGEQPDLRLCLLDISPPLVQVAYRHASEALERRGVATFALVGNFLELRKIPVMAFRPSGSARRRLYTMFGCTAQNLEDEIGYLRQLHACAAPGDLVALDLRLARAPAGDAAAIRAMEPVLTEGPPESMHAWLGGPIKRHCEGFQSIRFRAELVPRGAVAGSYEIDLMADVLLRTGEQRTFCMLRGKSYEPEALTAAMSLIGWTRVGLWHYGIAQKPNHLLMLLRRD